MFITFDSRVELTWIWPVRTDGIAYSMTHPIAGDGGAAIFDAVDYALNRIQSETGTFRRIILLLSESQDDGSQTLPEDLVRRLGESNTAVYSLSFSPNNKPSPRFGSEDRTSKAHTRRSSKHSDGTLSSSPLGVVVKTMERNAPKEISALSGGRHLKFRNEAQLEECLSAVKDDIHNRYILSFQPSLHEQGFHTLAVGLDSHKPHVDILSRTGYWYENNLPQTNLPTSP